MSATWVFAKEGLEETALVYLAIACHWTGAWDDAAIHAAAAVTTATTGQLLYAYGGVHAVSAWAPAGRGDADRARHPSRGGSDGHGGTRPGRRRGASKGRSGQGH
ncbi:hypothetical protein J7E97_15905 [Streptomyces sp. ISL-66]|uniref:hypothetical protein n=1 Tax=Streptomyces sp. ISL-66 TaxID=2819186 RepID=UPI001BE4E85E|nr:hypothetical protein [Streptomyces sp. ISL-66]MBT2469320.1 hypothetical protein [Streptomyces sp. ISL-66]